MRNNTRLPDMGYDATCTMTLDGRRFQGSALLEEKELRFRGDVRLVIPLAALEQVSVRDGALVLVFGGRQAVVDLGPAAEQWARLIRQPRARGEKLGIRTGMRVALVGLDDVALKEDVLARGADVEPLDEPGAFHMIFFAPADRSDLARLPVLAARLTPAGAVWLVRAKGPSATITERESRDAGKAAGLVDVKVVSYSATLTAEKYVVPVARRDAPTAAARKGTRAAQRD